jgi:hypothetical protein
MISKLCWITAIALAMPTPLQAQPVQFSSDTPILLQPVQPSPWWQVDRQEPGLIESWSVEPAARLVKFKINPQVWLVADYIKRYSLIQKLGSIARQNNYDLAIEDNRKIKLAEYVYAQGAWQIQPQYLGSTPFRANQGSIFGLKY